MRIATWNVNSLTVRLPQVLSWLADNPVDVLCLQETKCVDEKFPADPLRTAGYHPLFSGQKTYNGVALLSRTPPQEPLLELPGVDPAQKRFSAATVAGVRVVNLYVPNGAQVGSDKYAYKLAWLAALEAHLRDALARWPRLVVVGDFNIAPEDRDVYDPAAWAGGVLVSPPERAAFQGLLGLGLADTFRQRIPEPGQFSWWDYRAGAFRRNMGLRIDHILASSEMAEQLAECTIDRVPRGWDRPSDHAPVVATFR